VPRASLPPAIPIPRREHLCRGCGKTIQSGCVNCAHCAIDDATKNMLDAARIGRLTANGPEAQAKRAEKARKNALSQHSWKASEKPAWLTQEMFEQKIQPCSRTFPCLAFDRHLESQDGMQARFGKAIGLIQGTGSHWRNSLALHPNREAQRILLRDCCRNFR